MKYGWVPDLPDHRDQYFTAPPPVGGLPSSVNLHSLISTVYDQGDLGSCTANAIGQSVMMCLTKQKSPVVVPSRLFIYYNERKMEGTINEDAGAMIRDGMRTVAQQGVCTEASWPYDVKKFAAQPPVACYSQALNHQVLRYLRVTQTLNQIKLCIAVGYPFVFGMAVFESMESDAVAASGNVPMPSKDEQMLGGHAIIGIGYNSGPDIHLPKGDVWPSQTILVQNSWGTSWGMPSFPGCFTLPFSYAANKNLADDFWTVRLVEA